MYDKAGPVSSPGGLYAEPHPPSLFNHEPTIREKMRKLPLKEAMGGS